MEFLKALIETLVRMAIIIIFAYGGINLGRFLRRIKDEKAGNKASLNTADKKDKSKDKEMSGDMNTDE